ncbi:MAG: prolyl oligopeptidase family serine peptidase [Gammaproteobacteria bacterium]|nr:prolyl oligopeptidase family serine peptidase [Gammaproteobacteria bacterium]
MVNLILKRITGPINLLFMLVGLVFMEQAIAEKIPLKAWVHDPVISSVNVNPSGTRLVALTLSDINKAAEITVWNLNDLSQKPFRFPVEDSKPLAVTWLNDDSLFILGRQKYDFRFSGRYIKNFRNRLYIARLGSEVSQKKKVKPKPLFNDREDIVAAEIMDRLPLVKDKVLVSLTNREFAEDLYEVNLKTLAAKRVNRGAPGKNAIIDQYGKVFGRTRLETGSKGARIVFSYKHPKTGKWEDHHELKASDREGMRPIELDIDGRTLYVSDNTGLDKSVLKKYDLINKTLSDPIYSGDFEATGVVISRSPSSFGKLIAYTGMGSKAVANYLDEDEKRLRENIKVALPKDESHSVSSRSDDSKVIVITSSGPREAARYSLLINGKELLPLGRAYPELDPEKMSVMEYVEYKARDGMTIPAYLTKPKYGEAPYPTIIMPHGGPWARDFFGWDSWAQFLANRGYAVLQPQYRGSDGWGQELWRAGDNEWGQKMQDDKDDGASWLVDEGVSDKNRIAMFGYSYGGYAAMAAVVRPNSPYQCAIAGAGLSELRTFVKITSESAYVRELQSTTIGGLSPLDHVEKANIPLYIFHGDRDQIVPVEQSRKYYKALKKAGKDVEYNEIRDLWHSLPWWPTHHYNMFSSLEDYLANRCGPGGL